MGEALRQSHWLWPWLHAAGLGLAASYPVLWYTEFYLFVLVFLAGAPLFFGTYIGMVAFRLLKQRRPWIDRPAVVLLLVMIAVHLAGLAALKTVNWC